MMVTKYKMYNVKYDQRQKDISDLMFIGKIIIVIGISSLICGGL